MLEGQSRALKTRMTV